MKQDSIMETVTIPKHELLELMELWKEFEQPAQDGIMGSIDCALDLEALLDKYNNTPISYFDSLFS